MAALSAFQLFLLCSSVALCVAFRNGRPSGGLLLDPELPKDTSLPPDQWFTQRLTHFDAQDKRTWQQRYFVNDTFYKPGGPVFLQIGGEGTANPVWVTVGNMMVLAQKYNAMAVLLEHRFYGKSHPLDDLSLENLQFLSSEQALADLANFRTWFGKEHQVSEAKWISFGGSYPGALSAWFRLKYPHLVHGSVASSAPVQAKVNFIEYLEVVQRSMAFYGTEECVDVAKQANSFISSIINTQEGREKLSSMFKTCKPLTDDIYDISNFANSMAGNFMGVVQYNRDNVAFEGRRTLNVSYICNIMVHGEGDPLERYAAVNDALLKLSNQSCADVAYADTVTALRNVSYSAAEGGRQWMYQVCSEFAFLQSSDGTTSNQPFGHLFPLSTQVQLCVDVFGPTFGLESITSSVEWSNSMYGALKIGGTRIVFVNGNIDPWHALSVLPDTDVANPSLIPVFINGTAHCANMYPSSSHDLTSLIEAREKIDVVVGEFLSAEY